MSTLVEKAETLAVDVSCSSDALSGSCFGSNRAAGVNNRRDIPAICHSR